MDEGSSPNQCSDDSAIDAFFIAGSSLTSFAPIATLVSERGTPIHVNDTNEAEMSNRTNEDDTSDDDDEDMSNNGVIWISSNESSQEVDTVEKNGTLETGGGR